ncbi:MAG TPA: hypothetical protein VHB74_12580 [Devosia sp.]|nr:hypothetical protein [Devosia sp.]
MRFPFLAIVLSLVAVAPASASDLSASQLGAIFCAAVLNGDMTPLKDLLTPDLGKRIADAEAKNAAFLKAYPGAKAPLPEGIPWRSRVLKPAGCMLVGMSGTYEVPVAIISYTFDDAAQNYADKLDLRFVDDQLRLDNVDYADGGDLRSRLAAAFPD